MTTVIHKYELEVGINTFDLPSINKVLTAQMQNDKIVLWVLLDEKEKGSKPKDFIVVPTGQRMPSELMGSYVYISTVQNSVGLVYHIFAEKTTGVVFTHQGYAIGSCS